MLRKLIKHEFRATGRIMLPMYLILLLTAAGANITGRGMLDSDFEPLNLLGVLIVTAFGIAITAAVVLAFTLMVQRFYKNLLQDEGYLMFTLPVSVHQHIWAKLIVSAAWFVLTVLAVIAASMVMAYDVNALVMFNHGVLSFLHELLRLNAGEAINGTVLLIECLVLVFLFLVAFCLQFYAALAVGCSFANHKLLTSVGCFFLFQFVVQFLGGSLIISTDHLGFFDLDRWNPTPAVAAHTTMLIMIACVVAYGAIFYAITAYFLKRRLNLE